MQLFDMSSRNPREGQGEITEEGGGENKEDGGLMIVFKETTQDYRENYT